MIVCALGDGQQSSAAAAYAAWLSESLGLPLRLHGAETPDELIATVARDDAGLLVVAAAASAGELAARLGGRLVIAHAVSEPLVREPASSGAPLDGLSGCLRATERSELLERTLAKLRECPAEVCFTEIYGEPVEVLDGVGAAESAALIAVGSRGVGMARLTLAGSIAASLLRRATRPVLVLPATVAGVAASEPDELESAPAL
jgi:nucleotide-binding universal stress UspA family protein